MVCLCIWVSVLRTDLYVLTKSYCVLVAAAGPRSLPPFIPEPEPMPSKLDALKIVNGNVNYNMR